MKVGFLSLMLAAAGIVIPVAAQAVAEHYQLDIPRQQLDAALKDLAQQTGLQIARFSDTPGGSAFVGPVKGDMPVTDALKTLLAPSKLTYKIVNDHTIAVMTFSNAAAQTQATDGSGASQSATASTGDEKQQEGKKSTGNAFRLAQANQGTAQKSSTVGSDAQSTQSNLETSSQLTEVIVTAEKKSERLQDAPVPVTVLNTAKLTENGQVLLRDYFYSAPGFDVIPNNVMDQNLSIRGVTTAGSSTPTVGVVIDDVPFGASAGAHGNHVPDIYPGDLASIEVLRGPQGTLYGADSLGGLVKFVTAEPSTDGYSGRFDAGFSTVQGGQMPGFNMGGAINIPLTDTLAVRASGFEREDPGYIDNPVYHLDDVNSKRSEGARLSALWLPADTVSLKLGALYQQAHNNGLDEVDVQPGLVGLQQNTIPGTGAQDLAIQVYTAVLKAKLGSIDLTSLSGYNVTRESDSLDWGFVYSPRVQTTFGVTGAPYFESDDVKKFTQETRLSIPLGHSVDWLVGGYYTHERDTGQFSVYAEDVGTGQTVGTFWNKGPIQPNTFEEYAAFTDLTYRITDQFDIQAGGRESHINNLSGETIQTGPYTEEVLHAASPVIGAATASHANAFTYLLTPRFKVSSDLMVYARLTSGYRPGTPNLPMAGVPSQSDPDKTRNYEIGVKADLLDHRVSIDSSVYYINWSDIQITQINPISHYVYNTNGSGAKSEGVETSVTARPTTGLSVAGWIAYDDAVLTQPFPASSPTYGLSGERLPFSSKWSGNVSVEQEFPLWARATGFVGGAASYVGDRTGTFTGNALRQDYPSYTRTDLRTGVKVDSWTVNLYATNVADQRGVLSGGVGYFRPYAFTYITPRTIGLNVVKLF